MDQIYLSSYGIYNSMALTKMGSEVGQVIKLDRDTKGVIRGKFARLCVELDLSVPLVFKFLIRKHLQTVEYEGIHLIYFHCGRFTDLAKAIQHEIKIFPQAKEKEIWLLNKGTLPL
ncbi:hypothetical protein REPUB_Repub02eG0098200 [Reevesia pubescens]